MATIYNALVGKLGRTPTDAELKAEVKRIISEGTLIGIQRRLQRPKSRKTRKNLGGLNMGRKRKTRCKSVKVKGRTYKVCAVPKRRRRG